MVWQSSDNSIASVSNGYVTALKNGDCDVSVTDGLHGLLRVNITVIADSNQILKTPAYVSWPFSGDVLVMKPNTTQSVAGYTLYNRQGRSVNMPITLIQPTDNDIIVSGNSITSKSQAKSFNVKVLAGADTLANTLNVVVANTDTVYSIGITGSFARNFFRNNVTAPNPVLLSVKKCWFNGNVPAFSNYVTSPDKIELYGDNSVTLNAQGKFQSVKASTYFTGTTAKIIYKNVYVIRNLHTSVNISDSWGVTKSNGDTYNYCIIQTGIDIYFNGDEYYIANSPPQTLSGSYKIMENNLPVYYNNVSTFTGVYKPHVSTGLGYPSIDITDHPGYYLDGENRMVRSGAGTPYSLQRAAGNCGPSGPATPCSGDSLTLLNLLTANGTSATWNTSPCYANDAGISYFTFNGDFTGSLKEASLGVRTITWRIVKDKYQPACIYGFEVTKVNGLNQYQSLEVYETFLSPYSGNKLNFTQAAGSCNISSYFITKQ